MAINGISMVYKWDACWWNPTVPLSWPIWASPTLSLDCAHEHLYCAVGQCDQKPTHNARRKAAPVARDACGCRDTWVCMGLLFWLKNFYYQHFSWTRCRLVSVRKHSWKLPALLSMQLMEQWSILDHPNLGHRWPPDMTRSLTWLSDLAEWSSQSSPLFLHGLRLWSSHIFHQVVFATSKSLSMRPRKRRIHSK